MVLPIACSSGGRNAFARNAFGRNAFGRNAFGRNAFGRNAFGRNAFGRNAFGRNAFGRNAFGRNAFGRNAFARNAFARNAFAGSGFRKLAAAFAAVAFCAAWAGAAWAGSARWLHSTAQEEDGAWSLTVEIRLNRAPVVAYVPVRFTFQATSYFESALVDGREAPIVRRIPVANMRSRPFNPTIVQDMEVGFNDPATGKVHRRSRLSVRLTRESGFIAGEYEVDLVDSRSGRSLSSPVVLRLNGQNEVLNRRSMDFSAPSAESKAPSAPTPPAEPALTPDDDAFWQGGEAAPVDPPAALPPPAHLQERPGCGCRVAGRRGPWRPAAWVGVLGLAGWAARRRLSPAGRSRG